MTAKEIAMFNMDASFEQPMDSDKLHVLLFEPVDKLVMQVETSCITAMYHFSRLGYISFFLEKTVFCCVGCMEWVNRWVVLAVAFASFFRVECELVSNSAKYTQAFCMCILFNFLSPFLSARAV